MRDKQEKLRQIIQSVYSTIHTPLPFHGMHHLQFVANKAVVFAQELHADTFLVESAAWVHDSNYLKKTDYNSPEEGTDLRKRFLTEAGYTDEEITRIEHIVTEINTWSRDEHISPEGKALSDADMLFKCLPITPIIFSHKYMEETGQSLEDLAQTVVKLQGSLLQRGIYFYSDTAKKGYLPWAETTVGLFQDMTEALKDPDIAALIR